MNDKFIDLSYRVRKWYYHFLLGLRSKTFMVFMVIMILAVAYIFMKLDEIIAYKNFLNKEIQPMIKMILKGLLFLAIPLLFVSVAKGIGNFIALKDETDIEKAFKKAEIRNGALILISKKKDRSTKVTTRVFYSQISMEALKLYQNKIADSMNIHFVEDFAYYKNNGNKIVMVSAKGRIMKQKGILYYDG